MSNQPHTRTVITTSKAPPPLPVYNQAIVCGGMVYCSGQIPADPVTKKQIDAGIGEKTVRNFLNYLLEFS